MMDVLVREASYLTDGPLAIVRLGISMKLSYISKLAQHRHKRHNNVCSTFVAFCPAP